MAHDVFISHSAKNKTTGDAVCAVLEAEGIRCWIAPRDVTPGRSWPECIIEAIEQSQIMVLVFTADANASPQIRREVQRAVDHGVAIIPFRVEDVPPVRALEYFIADLHWLDALTPPLEARLKELVEAVKALLAKLQQEPQPKAQATPGPASRLKRAPIWAWGGAVALALVLAAVPVIVHRWHPAPVVSPAGASPPPAPQTDDCGFIGQSANGAAPQSSQEGAGRVAGLRWVACPSGTGYDLRSIFGTSDGKHLWAVGMSGIIVRSEDGGATWKTPKSSTTNGLNSISGASDGKRLWAVGDGGAIVESDDGGVNWFSLGSNSKHLLSAIFAAADGKQLWAGWRKRHHSRIRRWWRALEPAAQRHDAGPLLDFRYLRRQTPMGRRL